MKTTSEENAGEVIAAHIAEFQETDPHPVKGFETLWHWLIPEHMRVRWDVKKGKFVPTISRSTFQNWTKGRENCFAIVGWARAYWIDAGKQQHDEQIAICNDILKCLRPKWTTIKFSPVAKAALS